MPKANSDVIIVGGGITGCSAAYFLSKEGLSVTLIEKDAVAAHASGFAFGALLPRMFDDHLDPAGAITQRSLELHREVSREMSDDSGEPLLLQKAAVLLADSDASAEQYRGLYRVGNVLTGDIRWLEQGELSHLEARISPEVRGGLYLGDTAEINPYQFTNALWTAAESHGARMVNDEVTSVQSDSNGVTVVAGNEPFRAERVVIAAGPWSSRLISQAGAIVPVEPLKGQIIRLNAPGPAMRVSLWWGHGEYAGSKSDGLLWSGTTEEPVGFDEQPDAPARESIFSSAKRILPFLKYATVVKQTACLRPISADGLPVIGLLGGDQRIVVATGGGRNGIVLGPGLGRAAADFASGRVPDFDVTRLSPERFSA